MITGMVSLIDGENIVSSICRKNMVSPNDSQNSHTLIARTLRFENYIL